MTLTQHISQQHLSNHILQVCCKKSLTCLHAIESGSRAWGFASPDSDYDVRLIYHHHPDWYLRLIAEKDTFEYIQNDLFDVPFDIGGWDVRKALTLLYKSNAVIFEWLNSPIVYHSDDTFIHLMRELQPQFFDPKALFYHYRGMAKTANHTLNTAEPLKLKKWFYLLRALLASIWVLTERTHPPVLMSEMFGLLHDPERQAIIELIALKQQVDESYVHQLPQSLQALTERLWQEGNQLMANHTFADGHQGDIGVLDEVFKTVVFNQ